MVNSIYYLNKKCYFFQTTRTYRIFDFIKAFNPANIYLVLVIKKFSLKKKILIAVFRILLEDHLDPRLLLVYEI